MDLEKEPQPPIEATSERLLAQLPADLGDHYFWLPKVLLRAGAWRWLVPWPLIWLALRWRDPNLKEHGSVWLTAVILGALALGTEYLQSVDVKYTAEASRLLFASAFLILTMLSLSVALPGQAILRLVLRRNPLFSVDFVAPTLWAFLWSIVAGTIMIFYADLPSALKVTAAVAALYAFAMDVHAILYTVRMYLLGLVLTVRESRSTGDKP